MKLLKFLAIFGVTSLCLGLFNHSKPAYLAVAISFCVLVFGSQLFVSVFWKER